MSYQRLFEYCGFDLPLKPNMCHMLMLLPRKKENDSNTEKDKLGLCQRKIVRNATELAEALEYFTDFAARYTEVVFRVYVSAEKRDISKALFLIQQEVNSMVKDMYYGNEQVFDRTVNLNSTLKTVLMKPATRGEKTFLFDVDYNNTLESDQLKFEMLVSVLTDLTTVKYAGKSLNGYAIVTECFNPGELKKFYPNFNGKGMVVVPDLVEIKTNGMLYVGVYNHDS
jgi:hypothetical protein